MSQQAHAAVNNIKAKIDNELRNEGLNPGLLDGPGAGQYEREYIKRVDRQLKQICFKVKNAKNGAITTVTLYEYCEYLMKDRDIEIYDEIVKERKVSVSVPKKVVITKAPTTPKKKAPKRKRR